MKKADTPKLKLFNPDTQTLEPMNFNAKKLACCGEETTLLQTNKELNAFRYFPKLLVGFFMMFALVGMKLNANAQISYTSSGSNYTQNFDNLYTDRKSVV